jgi:methylmalonyl-CoA/ethylmalonyl-CoA epimerase
LRRTEKEMDFRDCPILWPWPSRVNQCVLVRPSVPAIHHLGWAVRSIDKAREHFETALGLEFRGEESHPDVRVAFFGIGQVAVELLEPLDDNTDIGMFLARRGEGIHHLALKVDDVAAALEDALRRGFVPIDKAPHGGSRGTVVGLVDPLRADGVLIQYVQEP